MQIKEYNGLILCTLHSYIEPRHTINLLTQIVLANNLKSCCKCLGLVSDNKPVLNIPFTKNKIRKGKKDFVRYQDQWW